MTIGKNNTSLTDQLDSEIREIFESLLEVKKSDPKEGKGYFSLQPDREATSYYEIPKHPEQSYFSFIDTKNQELLTKSLADLWRGKDNELLPMAAKMSEMAFKLRELQGEQSTDLSPFIYTLY